MKYGGELMIEKIEKSKVYVGLRIIFQFIYKYFLKIKLIIVYRILVLFRNLLFGRIFLPVCPLFVTISGNNLS